MTKRFNHVAEAMGLRVLATEPNAPEMSAALLAAAQVHATLALVEQQRITNLIALHRHEVEHDIGGWSRLYDDVDDLMGDAVLKPDIAAALGLTAGQEGKNDE